MTTMDRVLVGVDGSSVARGALGWSSNLARRAGLDVVAARVFVPTQAELPSDVDAALRVEQHHELEQWCASLAAGGPPARAVLLDGDAPEALLAAANDVGADLIVVGGRGTSGRTDRHLSSVAQHLVQYATRPLAVVSNGDATPLRYLVIGVDGSDASRAAVMFAAELAHRLSIGVTAVHASEPLAERVDDSGPRSWRHHAAADADEWVTPIDSAGVKVELDVDMDVDRVDAIARAVDAHPGAAVVVGARDLSEVTGMRTGRLALHLVHRTGAPVILVPIPNR